MLAEFSTSPMFAQSSIYFVSGKGVNNSLSWRRIGDKQQKLLKSLISLPRCWIFFLHFTLGKYGFYPFHWLLALPHQWKFQVE